MRSSSLCFVGSILLTLVPIGCQRPRQASETEPEKPAPAKATPLQSSTAAADPSAPRVKVGDVASCEPTRAAMQSTLAGLVRSADVNGDGEVSRDEAESVVNFLVGGFMYRADANGDGTVTPEEGRKARMELAEQHPALAALLAQVRATTGTNPFHQLASFLDVNYKKPIKAADARAVALVVLKDIYQVVDKNHDGAITEAEARAAAVEGANALGDRAFAAADANKDGFLDVNEFEKPLDVSAKVAFRLADANHDQKLTEDEARAALGSIARRLDLSATLDN